MLRYHAPEVAASLGPDAGDRGQVARVLTEIADSFLRFQVVALREAEQRAELARVPDVVATVPYFDSDIYDLAGLLDLGRAIWEVPPTGRCSGGGPRGRGWSIPTCSGGRTPP